MVARSICIYIDMLSLQLTATRKLKFEKKNEIFEEIYCKE